MTIAHQGASNIGVSSRRITKHIFHSMKMHPSSDCFLFTRPYSLTERVQEEKPIWMEAGTAFILSVTRLLERLLDYRSVMQGDENRDKRMSCTVNLLNFYKTEINRKEMYLRYIYKLFDLHTQAENYTEAGFTLKLYADMLSWDKETLTFAPNDNVGQPEWQRKENLYQEVSVLASADSATFFSHFFRSPQILKNFDKGKCWEKGIPLCKELAIFYETKRFDYNCLSHILILEAKFFQNILTQIRLEPEYFRVGFYGMGFPLFVRVSFNLMLAVVREQNLRKNDYIFTE